MWEGLVNAKNQFSIADMKAVIGTEFGNIMFVLKWVVKHICIECLPTMNVKAIDVWNQYTSPRNTGGLVKVKF